MLLTKYLLLAVAVSWLVAAKTKSVDDQCRTATIRTNEGVTLASQEALMKRSPAPMRRPWDKLRNKMAYKKLGTVKAETSASLDQTKEASTIEMTDCHEPKVKAGYETLDKFVLLDRLLHLRCDIESLESLPGFVPPRIAREEDAEARRRARAEAEARLLGDLNEKNLVDETDTLLCDIRDGKELVLPTLNDEICKMYKVRYEVLVRKIKKGLEQHKRSKATLEERSEIISWAREAIYALDMIKEQFKIIFTEAKHLNGELDSSPQTH